MEIVNVTNRTEKDFEFMYDSRVYKVPARRTIPMVEEVAKHGVKKSMFRWNSEVGTAEFALAIEGRGDTSPIDGRQPGEEFIERDPNEKIRVINFENKDAPKARVTGPLSGNLEG